MNNGLIMRKRLFSKKMVLPLVLLILVLIIGTSYALWQMTFRQTETNRVNTDCFKVEFNDKNPITLGDAYPMTDEEAENLTPYEFTITNICSEHARFEVNLEVINQTTLMNHSYIKTMYNDGTPKILTSYEKVDKTLDDAVDSYNLEVGYLETNESRTINLRLWLSEDTPLSEDTMNKSFSSKVTVTTSYAKKTPGTLRTISSSDTNGMWEYKTNITKLVIQNKLNKINGAIKVSDESETKDESIMSYVVPNEDGETYTAYLQGQDVIYLNPDSSYLFYYFIKLESIEEIKYLNTSNVTDMSNLFRNCGSLTSLDLSNFDTSKVSNMSVMFNACFSLVSLDVSSFDTGNVEGMDYMFSSCRSLTNLDLSNFDTCNVTNMGGMFAGCSSLSSLDLGNFNTTNVTNMSVMFQKCDSLTRLDLSGFDTINVTSMNHMFSGCKSLTILNLSGLNTSNVRTMSNMFYECSGLTSIIYGDNFIHIYNSDTTNMFNGCPANKPTHSSWNGVL